MIIFADHVNDTSMNRVSRTSGNVGWVLMDGQRRGNDGSSASRDRCPPAHRCTMPANHYHAIAVSDREPIRSTAPSAPTRALILASENVRSRSSDGNSSGNNDDDDGGMNQGRPRGTQRDRRSSHHASYAKGDTELSLFGQRDGSPVFRATREIDRSTERPSPYRHLYIRETRGLLK